jgi:non-ribosomal peptide synthetase component F
MSSDGQLGVNAEPSIPRQAHSVPWTGWPEKAGLRAEPCAEETALETTFPRLMLEHAKARPQAPALREKEYGIWQTTTWRELADEVAALACGMAEAGLSRGQHIVIVGDSDADIGAGQSLSISTILVEHPQTAHRRGVFEPDLRVESADQWANVLVSND